VKKVEIPGHTQLLANSACLTSSSQTTCSEKNNDNNIINTLPVVSKDLELPL